MIFRRNKPDAGDIDAGPARAAADIDEFDGGELDEDELDDDELDEEELDDEEVDGEEPADEWEVLDESRDWRDDGPFDISEVDLSGDAESGIERLDFGSLIVTPDPEVAIQLQIEQQSQRVQALLALHGSSGLEVALFAAPARSSMLPEVREALESGATENGGNVNRAEGPFGTELRRLVPVQGPQGEEMLHASRIWLVQGPRWLLRGTLMGESAMSDANTGSAGVLIEFFKNLVVSRDDQPRVPGDLVWLSVPDNIGLADPPAADV